MKSSNSKTVRKTIGVIGFSYVYEISRAFYNGIEDAARERNLNIVHFTGGISTPPENYPQRSLDIYTSETALEWHNFNTLFTLVNSSQVDGLILWAGALVFQGGMDNYLSLISHYHPIPMISIAIRTEGIPAVMTDGYNSIKKLVHHLVKVHHRKKIAFIKGPANHQEAADRYKGYVDGLHECSLPLDSSRITEGIFSRSSGKIGTQTLLKQTNNDIDAIVCVDDDNAIGAIEELKRQGFRVPKDISITGFDDCISNNENPPITTVSLHAFDQARTAALLLDDKLKGKDIGEGITIPTQIVIRQSCGCLPSSSETADPLTIIMNAKIDNTKDVVSKIELVINSFTDSIKINSSEPREISEAICKDIENQGNNNFIEILNRIINRSIEDKADLQIYKKLLSTLHCVIIRSFYDDEKIIQIESIFRRSHSLIDDALLRINRRSLIENDDKWDSIRAIGQLLSSSLSLNVLADTLASTLPTIGISGCFMMQYDRGIRPPENVRLLLAYVDGTRFAEDENIPYSASELIPRKLFPTDRRFSYIASPLFFRREHLGAIYFEGAVSDTLIFETLRGQISNALKIAILFTEQKKAEHALANEKERLRLTLMSIGDGVITTDKIGNVILMNRVAENMTGCRSIESYGVDIKNIFVLSDNVSQINNENPVYALLNNNVDNGFTREYPIVSKNKTEYFVSAKCSLVYGHDGSVIGTILVFRDITEKRRLEEELHKASKLESVGILAGGIAHDFNNILTSIMGNISLARAEITNNESISQILAEAEDASYRAKDLTQQLLTFSKGGNPVKKPASIDELLKETAAFTLRGSNANCEYDLEINLMPVSIDKGQISQVINNILINAIQSMPAGGTISVRARNIEIKKPQLNIPLPGCYIKIDIADQGIGIPKENLQKIFDPYFTTKPEGNGLGLATAYSILLKHQGGITVDSIVGKGTVFSIFLPADKRAHETAGAQYSKIINPSGESKHYKILVMDDEYSIRKVTQSMLKKLGHEAHFTKDGNECIDLYILAMHDKKPFDAVIMDLTIPGGMGGRETITKLITLDPKARVIVSSGYSTDPIMSNYAAHGFIQCLTKPYTINQLENILNEIMIP